jgi:hypothetical protein
MVIQLGVISRMALAAAFDCQKIIDKIGERFIIEDLDSLMSIGPGEASDFYVQLVKKEDPSIEVAHINGQTYGNGIIYIETLHRYGFGGANNSTKGAGLLLLDLVSCFAARNNLTLTLVAMPNSAAEMPKNNMRLYNFYERAGLKPSGDERVVSGVRRKHFRTAANNLRKSLQNRYKGGGTRKRRRH